MDDVIDLGHIAMATTSIRSLIASKAEAEDQVVSNLTELVEAIESLALTRSMEKTPENTEALNAAEKAWQASIKAYELGIVAFKGDIIAYDIEIDSVLKLMSGKSLAH